MHPKQIALEDKMNDMCQNLDNHLEDLFGSLYRRHPNRLERGKAASGAYDGLFSTNTQFTMGYGTDSGRGYVVNVEIRTLEWVSEENRKKVDDEAERYLTKLLGIYFPERNLMLIREGKVLKIVGDFSLGSLTDN